MRKSGFLSGSIGCMVVEIIELRRLCPVQKIMPAKNESDKVHIKIVKNPGKETGP